MQFLSGEGEFTGHLMQPSDLRAGSPALLHFHCAAKDHWGRRAECFRCLQLPEAPVLEALFT